MRARVRILGLVLALVLASPLARPVPALAAESSTVAVDGGVWRIVVEVIRKLSLEAYLLIDRVMDGARSGDGVACCCGGGTGCTCGGGTGGSGGGSGGGTSTGGETP